MRPRIAILLVLGLLLAAAAGCGGGEEATPTPDDIGTVPADTGGETDTGGTDTGGTDTGMETSGGETDTGDGDETSGDGGEGDSAAGKDVFASTGCGSCHTLSDAGSSGAVGPNLDESMPSFELVKDRVTNGAGSMPAFKDQLSEQQIDDVAAYVSDVAGA